MSDDLIRQKARERHFLEQLLDGRKLENYKIPVPIKAELRKYQQVGVCVVRERARVGRCVLVFKVSPVADERWLHPPLNKVKQLLEQFSTLRLSSLLNLFKVSLFFCQLQK